MQTLLLPAARAGCYSAVAPPPALSAGPSVPTLRHLNSLFPLKTFQSISLSSPYGAPKHTGTKLSFANVRASSTPISPTSTPPNDEAEKDKLAQVLFLLCCFPHFA